MDEGHTARFNMVMTPDERAMLQELAAADFRKESDVIRLLLLTAYRERFGDKKPGKPKPKYNSASVVEARAKKAKRRT
jgi:hypothetical protein